MTATAIRLSSIGTEETLDPVVRRLVIGLLGQQLADAVDLATQAKQAHWNVKGPDFDSLHVLFDGIHIAVEGYVDLLAERVVALGGVAFGTARQAAMRSVLPEYPAAVAGREHVVAMTAVLAAWAALLRGAVVQTAAWGDVESTALCADIVRGIDKWLWMVEAHGGAEDRPPVRQTFER